MTILAPIQRHIDALAVEVGFPAEAVAACVARPEASAPLLRAILQRAARGTPLSDAEAGQLFVGLHILAKLRDEQSFPLLLRLLRRPLEEVEDLLGDVITITLPGVAASLFDGDEDALFDLIIDNSIDQFIRDALWRGATYLTFTGRVDRDVMHGFIRRYDAERLAPLDDMGWFGWLGAIAFLGFSDLAPLVDPLWRDGRLPKDMLRRKDFDEDLAKAVRAPDDAGRFTKVGVGMIDDVAESLAWAEWDDPPMPIVNPMRGVGRNDPCPCGSGKKAKKCCLASGA